MNEDQRQSPPQIPPEEGRRIDETHLEVWVSEPPDKGRATEMVREALVAHLKVARSRITLVSGAASRNTVFKVE